MLDASIVDGEFAHLVLANLDCQQYHHQLEEVQGQPILQVVILLSLVEWSGIKLEDLVNKYASPVAQDHKAPTYKYLM
jgi:hypothetical protein